MLVCTINPTHKAEYSAACQKAYCKINKEIITVKVFEIENLGCKSRRK
ncbi:MAG: hypothetical protein L6V88_07915 [Anaerotruncus sp.]|nr:MAG: hypothetical protein L6V88_07915 [Anaerotruncus sp.]